MRKKSHVLVASFIANNVAEQELQNHRKAFCFGSILPDLKPSFLTTKHEFTGTFYNVQEKIKKLTIDCDLMCFNARVYYCRLGEVIHYVADYFTFPHNSTYKGTLTQHCIYEKELKDDLKTYIKSGHADYHTQNNIEFKNYEQLIDYIRTAHKQYLSQERNVSQDIYFILNTCYQVVQGMIQLLGLSTQLHNAEFNLVG